MTETRTYSVPGVTCDHCRQAIESEVGTVQGVKRVIVDVAAKTAQVLGGSDGAIREAIDEAGYDIVD